MFDECTSHAHGRTELQRGSCNGPLAVAAMVAATFAAGEGQSPCLKQRSSRGCSAVINELVGMFHAPRGSSERADRLFRAHVLGALAFCVVGPQDGLYLHEGNKGGLALWQLELATGILEAHVGERVSFRAVARECGLTASHFARAFRVSTGVAPSRWILDRRIAMSKTLLSTTPKKLSEIALDCGFTDQSHFTRVFGRRVGISPGRWRATLASERRLTRASERLPISDRSIGGAW